MLLASFDICYKQERPIVKEFFMLKCPVGKERFFMNTNYTTKFTKGFKNNLTFDKKVSSFFKSLKSSIFTSFKKKRVSNKRPIFHGDKHLNYLNKKRNDIKTYLEKKKCKLGNLIATSKLEEI